MVARAALQSPRTHGERLVVLEQRQETVDSRLAAMDTKVTEIHTILIGAKAILWLGAKISGWITLAATVTGASVAVYKLFIA